MEKAEYGLMFRIETDYWWYVARRWLVTRFLRRVLHGGGLKGLDVGCGTGGNIMALRRFAEMSGCDIAPEAVEFCGERGIAAKVQDAPDKVPFPDAGFDLVTAFDVLEHIDNDAGMLADMARTLKPGGVALLTVPAHPSLWSVHDVSMHHKRRYVRREMEAKVRAAGLVPVRVAYFNSFLLPLILPVRWLRTRVKRGQEATSDFNLNLPGWLNAVFTAVFASEWGILRFMSLPFGLSLLCLARKPE
jgi:SAM-dependent methyltransferase